MAPTIFCGTAAPQPSAHASSAQHGRCHTRLVWTKFDGGRQRDSKTTTIMKMSLCLSMHTLSMDHLIRLVACYTIVACCLHPPHLPLAPSLCCLLSAACHTRSPLSRVAVVASPLPPLSPLVCRIRSHFLSVATAVISSCPPCRNFVSYAVALPCPPSPLVCCCPLH